MSAARVNNESTLVPLLDKEGDRENKERSQAAVFLVVLMTSLTVDGKRFSRCELVSKFTQHQIPQSQLRDWLCLSEKESGMNSGKVGGPNKNGSFDYGIFQINGKYWCKKGKKGGDCNINCDDLVDSNIDDDIECAKKIYKRHGFSAWVAWRNKCDGKTLPSATC
uniref:lysozyme n=1 Tax=Timema shepardi TaxID=629360 RepID=A0A7R9ANG0_TIMSH|nr:unnamed protein product [Timema shepardi]